MSGPARTPAVRVPHVHPVRVHWEDTDAGGVAYHAGYLRWCERGRSEWARSLGLDQRALLAAGLALVVRRMECDWLIPARLDDLLAVETAPLSATGARALLDQRVTRDGATLFAARVTLAAVGPAGRPTRLPAVLAP